MDLGIDGKVALVTGSSRGLGFGIAKALAAEGVQVALASRSRARIDAAADQVPGAVGFTHDTQDHASAPYLVEQVVERFGRLDILVLNTGGPPVRPDPLDFSAADWQHAYESLQLGAVSLVQAALPAMIGNSWGRVVSVSSSSVREPIDNLILSTAHRAGLLAALKTLARAVAQDGVTINSLLPGRFATDRIVENYGSIETAQAAASAEIPIGRLGTIEEFAAAALFLCSASASYVTGTALPVDGGMTRSV
jgi:3-oxoacyl-[acyl-carrier protein] reductase